MLVNDGGVPFYSKLFFLKHLRGFDYGSATAKSTGRDLFHHAMRGKNMVAEERRSIVKYRLDVASKPVQATPFFRPTRWSKGPELHH